MPDLSADEPHAGTTCAFCRIIRGEDQASIIFEDSVSLAFLDRRPLFPGHCLLVPRQHFEQRLVERYQQGAVHTGVNSNLPLGSIYMELTVL